MRLAATYWTIAGVLLNTLVLAGALLVLLHYALPAPPSVERYSQHFKLESYTRISRAEAIAVGREFDRMGEQRSYEFDPWTLFRERAFDGELLQVSAAGVRRTIAPDPAYAARAPLNVWAFGGSTMFGWGMPDTQTIASHLQASLQARVPSRQVRVTNHGHAYFFSSVELSAFLAQVRTDTKPDLVVFLDGLNDALFLTKGQNVPHFADVLYVAWERERERQLGIVGAQPWITVNRSFPVFRLIDRLWPSEARGAFERSGRYWTRPRDPVAFALREYRTNRAAIAAVGESQGIPTHQFLQPTPWYGLRRPGDPVTAFYDALVAEEVAGFHPLVGVVRELPHPYVDWGHYSDEGGYRVADAMATTIARARRW